MRVARVFLLVAVLALSFCALSSLGQEVDSSLAEFAADADQTIDVVVDQAADGEHEALLQAEVDAELGLDADQESEGEADAEVDAEQEESQAAKQILAAVAEDAAEDYPALVEAAQLHTPVIVPANIDAKREGEVDPVIVRKTQPANALQPQTQQLAVVEDGELAARAMIGITAQIKGSGCGPGKVADLFPIAGFNHHTACVGHDDCYARCGATKKQCDDVFYSDMQAICNSKYAGTSLTKRAGRKLCLSQAWAYYTAVHKLGAGPFSNAQKGAGCTRRF